MNPERLEGKLAYCCFVPHGLIEVLALVLDFPTMDTQSQRSKAVAILQQQPLLFKSL